MPIAASELLARVATVGSLVFTDVAAASAVAAVVVWLLARRLPGEAARRRMLLVASLLLLGWLVSPVPAIVWVLHAAAVYAVVEHVRPRPAAVAAFVALLLAMVAAPVWWIGALGELGPHVREVVAFGTNMALLRAVAYAYDRWRRGAPALAFDDYLLGTFFFPTLVNGPVESPHRAVRLDAVPTAEDLAYGLGRMAFGIGKIVLLAALLPPRWNETLVPDAGASVGRWWAWSLLLYWWFYASFSAWSDVAIGLGRTCGRRVIENFDRPWLATSVGDFWHRWHVSLGVWLRDYVYVPLGGNRRRRTRNVAATFLASAVWHVWGTLKLLGFGYYPVHAWWGFLLWGLLHGVVVVAGQRVGRGVLPVPVARVATLLFAAWAWVPFFAPASMSLATGMRVLARMLLPGIG
jgi:alginate O-acetyltransferase complex protein AlgI